MKKPFIVISQLDTGEFETCFYPAGKVDTVMVAIAMASATRVVAGSFLDGAGLPEVHREQIIAQIAEHYHLDLGLDDMGERESTRKVPL